MDSTALDDTILSEEIGNGGLEIEDGTGLVETFVVYIICSTLLTLRV
jgi:hypothetical protein